MDIIERLIVYRDRAGRSREGRELLAEAANEIQALRATLITVRNHLGIRPEFTPLGVALELEPIIRRALKGL